MLKWKTKVAFVAVLALSSGFAVSGGLFGGLLRRIFGTAGMAW
jgi:hypothetical protein